MKPSKLPSNILYIDELLPSLEGLGEVCISKRAEYNTAVSDVLGGKSYVKDRKSDVLDC